MPEPDPDAIDYYARIDVQPEADIETVERHRKQADRRFSPMGTSPEADEKRHMRINEASGVLEDRERRERYDDLYTSLGPINGTLAFETLSAKTIDAVRGDETLLGHLRGFVEVLGPKRGAREFQRYHGQLTTPLPEAIESDDIPDGYTVEDTGFGVAVWSWQRAGQPEALSSWLAGGRRLWRTALVDPEAVERVLADIRESGPAAVPDATPGSSPDDGTTTAGGTPTTQLSLGHPSSAATDRHESTESRPSIAEAASWLTTPVDRLRGVAGYVLATGGWAGVTVGGAIGSGLVGSAVAAVAFVPLLALALVVQSTAPEFSVAELPLADLDRPLGTPGLVQYVIVGLAAGTSAWLAGRQVVPRVLDRKDATLPRDAWLVFWPPLVALAGALFVGIGHTSLPRWPGLALTVALAAFTFQASIDVSAPRPLAVLCRSVSTLSVAVASAVAALAVIGLGLSVTYPAIFESYVAVLTTIPIVTSPVFGPANAELLVVSFGALAFVPLALTSLYSLAYALESVALRVRSYASGS